MIRKNRLNRIYLIFFFVLSLGAITFFVLKALEDNIDLYLTPTEVKESKIQDLENFKLGGMVKVDSVQMLEDLNVSFTVTDFENEINVTYSGVVPNLFTEGKGVVAEGYLKDKSFFLATKILAKHDENYMPPEVKAALEEK